MDRAAEPSSLEDEEFHCREAQEREERKDCLGCEVLERESLLARRESRWLVVERQVGLGSLVVEGKRDPESLLSQVLVEVPTEVREKEQRNIKSIWEIASKEERVHLPGLFWGERGGINEPFQL